MIWTVARVLLILAALGVFFIVPLYSQNSNGTAQLLTDGVVIDAVALIVLVASAWSLWREGRSSA